MILNDISAIDNDNAWACGDSGLGSAKVGIIIKWNGSSWLQQSLPSSPSAIKHVAAIHMLSTTEGYALAKDNSGSVILKFNGSTWSVISQNTAAYTPANHPEQEIYAHSSNLIFAAMGSVYKIQGSSWNDEGISARNIAFSGQTEGYSAGYSYPTNKYNGIGWSSLCTKAFVDISIGSDGILCAIGEHSTPYADSLYIFQNSTPGSGIYTGLPYASTICAISQSDVWLGGRINDAISSAPGAVSHYNGTTVDIVEISSARHIWKLYFHSSSSGWAIADNGLLIYR